jgi:glucokinase
MTKRAGVIHKMILAGDIGGTNTRLAFFEKGEIIREEKFSSRDHPDLETIIQKFLSGKKVKAACFGLAGTIHNDVCKTTNLSWVIDAKKIEKQFSIPKVYLLNDLEANAYGIKALSPEEFFVLQEGVLQKGNLSLVSAGTGLGEASLIWDGKRHIPVPSEGGHADFAPRNALEAELLLYLQSKYGRVSCERVISGPGLYNLFQFLIETGKETLIEPVQKEMKEKDPAKVLSEWGGQRMDPACTRALDWFISLYGAEAGNAALKFLPFGGMYIGGGIAPCLAKQFKEGAFCSSFCDKGRLKQVLESIPIRIIMNDQAALLGAALYVEEKYES